jgi:hypothetical protein
MSVKSLNEYLNYVRESRLEELVVVGEMATVAFVVKTPEA